MDLRDALRAVATGDTLARAVARSIFTDALSEGTDPTVFGALLAALAQRGETTEEIAGAADALRDAMTPFEANGIETAIDTCGTGGDGLGMFNLSTSAAIVASAAGARVVKHGNRSLSSRCGSADLLEAAGIPVDLSAAASRAVFEEVGITFLFAPTFHPAMRFAAPIRKALGIRTIFNYLGPLCNPARVRRQLLGTSDPARTEDFANVLEQLGHERAYVVHGAGGADELTLAGPNRALAVGTAPTLGFDATDVGLSESGVDALVGGEVEDNLRLLNRLLDPAHPADDQRPLYEALLLNTACALVIAELAADGREGVELARRALETGAALEKLETWRASAARHGGGAR